VKRWAFLKRHYKGVIDDECSQPCRIPCSPSSAHRCRSPTARRVHELDAPAVRHQGGEFELELLSQSPNGIWINFRVRHLRPASSGMRVWRLGWNVSEQRLAYTDARRDIERRFPEIHEWVFEVMQSDVAVMA
jgi:hypothetical protein